MAWISRADIRANVRWHTDNHRYLRSNQQRFRVRPQSTSIVKSLIARSFERLFDVLHFEFLSANFGNLFGVCRSLRSDGRATPARRVRAFSDSLPNSIIELSATLRKSFHDCPNVKVL